MISVGRAACVCWLIFSSPAPSAGLTLPRTIDEETIMGCQVDGHTAVRFFYDNRVDPDIFHIPLIFRPVAHGDQRLNTAPTTEEGRVAYVSKEDMRHLLSALIGLDLSWQRSDGPATLGPFKGLINLPAPNEIRVVCSKGVAVTHFGPKSFCEATRVLNSVIKPPRAVWELQAFRLNNGCVVPGFEFGKYGRF
jgi:hypothetical protein